MTTHGIPGLRGTEHIGFTVPDLRQAVDFFVDVVGCEAFYDAPAMQAEDDWMARHLNVHPRTVMRKLQFLRCGHGSNFELFEYESPGQQRTGPRNSDVGGHHLAFYVDDMEAAVAHLRRHGVTVLGEPKPSRAGGPAEGQTWVYFLAPWGMQLELVSYPGGKRYESTTDRRLWHPALPAR